MFSNIGLGKPEISQIFMQYAIVHFIDLKEYIELRYLFTATWI